MNISKLLDDTIRLEWKINAGAERTEFIPGETRLPLSVSSYGPEEVIEALDSLLSTYVTMGEKVKAFERMFADYIGVDHGVMTNSGSSANLLALTALKIPPDSEIITPAVTWATTVYPISQIGCIPVLVDVGQDYNIDPDAIERAITPKTHAILPVHLMGNPCAMDAIMAIAERNGIHARLDIIEDACEAHGAEWFGRKVGSFGDLAFFSFFFSHHISTIEGGMVVTNYAEEADLCRSMRAFGWTREMENREKAVPYPDIDPRFLFLNAGYNLRPTEIQGAFGMHQLPKLEDIIETRRANAAYFNEQLGEYTNFLILPKERKDTRHVWFGYPITIRPGAPFSRKDLVGFLESKGLETRPIGTGNIANQPVMKQINHRVQGNLQMAKWIDQNGFFFGCHEKLTEEQKEAIVGYFKEFFDVHTRN